MKPTSTDISYWEPDGSGYIHVTLTSSAGTEVPFLVEEDAYREWSPVLSDIHLKCWLHLTLSETDRQRANAYRRGIASVHRRDHRLLVSAHTPQDSLHYTEGGIRILYQRHKLSDAEDANILDIWGTPYVMRQPDDVEALHIAFHAAAERIASCDRMVLEY